MLKEPNCFINRETYYIEVLKNDWYKLLVKLENLISIETTKFYEKKSIITMHLPITTGSISSPMGRGSDSKPVKVSIENVETYLADSMQFLLEYGCRLNKNGVYYIMPSFRGESADDRHLCQFYHSEAEIPGVLEDVMNLVEEYIKYLSQKILETIGGELKEKIGDISHIEAMAKNENMFPRITFKEAEYRLKELYPNNIEEFIEYGEEWKNLTPKAEKELIKLYGGVIWVTNYDELAVPFYQQSDSKIKGTTRNADLLMGIGETVGCGERYKNYKELIKSIKKHEVNDNDYEWYINLKKMFPMQTSGFGMGIERFLLWVLKGNDIRNMQICLRINGEKSIV